MPVDFRAAHLAGAPALLAFPPGTAPPYPVALWYHGLGVDKETHRKELEQIAAAGILAVGIDAVAHGERADAAVMRRVEEATQAEALPIVVELAERTAREIPAVLDALIEEHGADPERLMVAGISMGGLIAYAAAIVDPRLARVAAVLGSPEWPGHPASPHLDLAALARVALLSVVAERDVNVPPEPARRLHAALAARHPAATQRLVVLAGAEHLMDEPSWERAMGEVLGWLRT